jgi:glycosyltransferase involved in cell wall biosynthesis
MDYSIVAVIPAFNEQNAIASVLLQTEKYVYSIIVVDDGSNDNTGEIASRLGATVIRNERNLGYGGALLKGFEYAKQCKSDIIVTLDADGQHNGDEIPVLLERIRKGDVDIVIGSRFLEGGGSEASAWRRAGIQVITDMVADGGVKVTDAQSGFRAYTRHALESLTPTEGMGLSTEILLKAGEKGLRIAEVPIHVTYDEGSSTQSPVSHGLDLVLNTLKHLSIRRPLVFYGLPGFISTVIALSFLVWTLQIFADTRVISTNLVLIAVGASTVGLMLMTTSIILWVIVSVVREKP